MTLSRRLILRSTAATALATSGWPTPLSAQTSWPSKPIRLVVPNAAGGGTDVTARILAERLAERLKQPVIVDNRPGAGGALGADVVAKSAPDGYTFFYTVSGFAATPVLMAKLPYDTRRDFVPVAMPVRGNVVIVVSPGLPINSLAELVTYSKARPQALNYGSPSSGVTLAVELFKSVTGANLLQVPYKGSAPAMTDFLADRIQVLFDPSVSIVPYIKSGRARALAVTGDQRDPAIPSVPTVQECGFAGFGLYSWQGLFAPAGTPKAVLERMEAELIHVSKLPETREKLTQLSLESVGGSAAELGQLLERDLVRWAKVAKQIGLTPQ